MCEQHQHSFKILTRDHAAHTHACCPKLPKKIPDKVAEWATLEGTYPVFCDGRTKVVQAMKEANLFDYYGGGAIRFFLANRISDEEFMSNRLTPHNYNYLLTLMADVNIKLIRRSPKVSNLILTLMQHAGIENPEAHNVVKLFNDRGDGSLNDYELVLTTEPHRIAGMSAYGDFSSCQDWIKHDLGSDHHELTHMSWSNLQDPTVGVAFIRRKGAVGPEEGGHHEDMLARALVRVRSQKNGFVMVYFHRLYGKAPFTQYLEYSMHEWAKTLDDKFYFIDMNHTEPEDVVGKTQSGQELTGCVWVSWEQDFNMVSNEWEPCCDCDGTGRAQVECDDCNGEGCDECNGRGYFDEECGDCNGEGGHTGNCSVTLPYNDHSDWLDFEEEKIRYKIPRFLRRYYDQPDEATEDNGEEIA